MRAALLVCLLGGTSTADPREISLVVGADPRLPLGATLTLPDGPGPFPAVVLVHGSGPSDRDETVGATHMFADLAAGLAARGIAVLRYDKRTFTYGDRLTNDLTLDDEVIDDAIDAVQALQRRSDISRVIIVGHSLGGMLAPEIATRAGRVAGVVLLSPPARPPLDILRDQLRYLGAPAELRGAVEQAAIVDALPLPPTEPLYVLGMPLTYWRDWEHHDGIASAAALTAPVLVIQGGRDYQVTRDDFALWKKGVPHATFVWMPADNHALISGRGRPGPREYAHEAHVDRRVIAKLAAFVLAR